MTAEMILALLLAAGPKPGKTNYSLVRVDKDAGSPCVDTDEKKYNRHDPLCRKPWLSTHHKSYVRVETREEAIVRWTIIADAVVYAISGLDEGLKDRAALNLLTVMTHESGLRRDVHEGIGQWSKGDGGRSWCLGQQMLGISGRKKTRTGVRAYKLVGLTVARTRNCVDAVHHDLGMARDRCKSGGDHCVFAVYGGLDGNTEHKGIKARAGTMVKYKRALAKEEEKGKE